MGEASETESSEPAASMAVPFVKFLRLNESDTLISDIRLMRVMLHRVF